MPTLAETENRATLSRATCGWGWPPHLRLEQARAYLRDVHGPCIARRAGIYDYRHYWFDEVRADLFGTLPGIVTECDPNERLVWVSDVRYLDEAALAESVRSPDADIRALILGDIDLVVHKSTTYRSVGANAHTYIDHTDRAAPQGPARSPTFGVYLRRRSDLEPFRRCAREIARQWANTPGVRRLRLSLFDIPDMDAERKAGYPLKSHAVEQQYQAWIDLTIESEAVVAALRKIMDGIDYREHLSTLHAYPVPSHYTPVYGGRPTLVGLRGYAAYEAIEALNASNQRHPELLTWLYGPVVRGGPLA